MAEFRFRRISHYRYEALTADGAYTRGTIKALDYEPAQLALQEQGLFAYHLKRVDAPEDLERRCLECNHQNDWTDMACANCGAAVRGPRVVAGERIDLAELADDFVIRENSDGSVTLRKAGWKSLAPTIVFLLALVMPIMLVIVREDMTPDDPAARSATQITNTIFGLLGIAVVIGVTLWMLFHREDWRVGKGYVEHRRSLFGMDRGHTFRAGIIRLEQFSQSQLGLHNLRVSVVDRETSRTLYEEQSGSDTVGRALAGLLSQRTGWLLDEHCIGWDGVPPGYEKFARFARWVDRIRGRRET